MAIRARNGVLLGCSLALGLAPAAQATVPPPDHFTWSWSFGLDYSDNRLRAETDREGDVWLSPRLEYSLLHGGERLQAHGTGELRSEHSLGGVADDRVRAHAALVVDWAILPHRFYWTFQDIATEQAIDPLAADEPGNQQQTNVFLTGPIVEFGSPERLLGRIESRVARAWAAQSVEFNHDRYSVAGSLQRQSDPLTRWTLGAEASEVEFQRSGAANDFTRQDVYLQYDHELPRSGVQLVGGYTFVDRAAGDSVSRALLRARLRWSPGADDEFRIDAADELSDAGRDLAVELGADDRIASETRRALIGPDVHRLRSLELNWRHRFARSEFEIAPFARDYHYLQQDQGLERNAHGLRVAAAHKLTPLLSLHAQAASAWFEFANPARRDRDSYLSVYLERRLTPRWLLRAGVSRFLRDSDFAGASYHENSLALQLVYAGGQ